MQDVACLLSASISHTQLIFVMKQIYLFFTYGWFLSMGIDYEDKKFFVT
jgi:hypothetical protein